MLVIVESPTKAKKIKSLLSVSTFATSGHFKDLPKKELGIDLSSLKYKFVLTKGKGDIPKKLKELSSGQNVVIASDADREGGAIAWFVYNEIKKVAKKVYRAEITEITEKGGKRGGKQSNTL